MQSPSREIYTQAVNPSAVQSSQNWGPEPGNFNINYDGYQDRRFSAQPTALGLPSAASLGSTQPQVMQQNQYITPSPGPISPPQPSYNPYFNQADNKTPAVQTPPGYPGQAYPSQPHFAANMSYEPKTTQPQYMAPMAMTIDPKNSKNIPRNVEGNRDWNHGLCDCFGDCGTCCVAWFCPCIVYSQVKSRLRWLNMNNQPHPQGGDSCGSDCFIHCCLTSFLGAGWVLQIGQRGDTRDRYRIEGGGCGDCMAAWCCTPCELTQQSREIQAEEQALMGGQKV